MGDKLPKSLWLHFVWNVFLILVITNACMFFLTIFLVRHGVLTPGPPRHPSPFLTSFITSVIVGTVLSLLVGKRIIKPISALGEAMETVAKGDLTVRFSAHSSIPQVQALADNFNRMTTELAGIETLRSDFVTNVSHEFKTPLAAIEGYAALLLSDGLSPQERQEYGEMIRESARQLSTLTGNILKLSKLENQEFIVEKKRFRLDEQIRQALLYLEPQWSKKDLTLKVDLQRADFFGSEELLMQVWLNLLGNAVKFTPAGGTIAAALTAEDAALTATIRDTGPGMSPETKARAFEKFYQGEAARHAEGNGLGLALVKRIVELSGGDIRVEGREGAGAAFIVRLPAAR